MNGLRDAVAGDLDEIARLEGELFAGEAWSRAMVREELAGEHRRYIVLEGEDDSLIGYAGVLVVGEEADIQTIAIVPEARGRGFGRLLMRELLDEAEHRGATQVFLEVRADNSVARRLYESLGFAEIAVRPRYYQPDGVDAVVMKHVMRGEGGTP